jgi:hypothetical protein
MSSKYPNKIDTSIEIPVVRDNITQINSSIINSLRSAIINIEKTLGINPNGGGSETVSTRLSQSLDESGNIKPEAISRMGILSGPITDKDVSDQANIKESKIKLDYPTSLLHSEISGTFGVLKDLLSQVEELNRSLSSHITEGAPNRHKASSIGVDAITSESSSTSLFSFEENNLQDLLKSIISSHINLSSNSISSINNSHSASQIFFNSENSSNISSLNVQDAIEDLSNLEVISFSKTLLKICSNGILRKGKVFDSYTGSEGFEAVSESSCNFEINTSPFTEIYFENPQAESYSIQPMDVVKISYGADISDEYFLVKEKSSSIGNVDFITVYGNPTVNSDTGTTCTVYKNYYKSFNMAGFMPVVRPNVLTTNDSNVCIIDPASATIIGLPIYFQFVEDDETLEIEIDGDSYSIPLYYSSIPFTYKNMDTAIYSINQYCADNNIPLISTKIRYDSCYSIVLSHMIPSFSSDIKRRYLKILNGTSDKLGLDQYLGIEIIGEGGGSSFINGEFRSIKSPSSIPSGNLNVSNLSNKLTLSSGSFSDYGVDKNCFVFIDNYGSNNGLYSISNMDDQTVTLDSSSPFSFDPNASPVFIFTKNRLDISELEFTEISNSDGEILVDIFMSEKGNIGISKRLEVSNISFDQGFSLCIKDLSKGFIENSVYDLNITQDLKARLSDSLGNFGPEVFVGSNGTYKIFDATELNYIVVSIFSDGTNLTSNKICQIFGKKELPNSVLKIGRFPYTTSLGKIMGVEEGSGTPVISDKRKKGVIASSDISEEFIEKFIEGPRSEIRGNGIVRGCEVINLSYISGVATFDIQPGVIFVNGIRYPYYGQQNIKYETNLNFYIVFNQDGCLEILDEVNDPYNVEGNISPYKGQEVLHLAHINLFLQKISKLAINLSNLDYKKSLDSITVSKDNKFCNFSRIQDALDFCNFSEKIFKNKITKINILEGEYLITEPLKIESYVELHGVGEVTILRDSNYINLTNIITEDFNYNNCLIQIGTSGDFNFFFSGKQL